MDLQQVHRPPQYLASQVAPAMHCTSILNPLLFICQAILVALALLLLFIIKDFAHRTSFYTHLKQPKFLRLKTVGHPCASLARLPFLVNAHTHKTQSE